MSEAALRRGYLAVALALSPLLVYARTQGADALAHALVPAFVALALLHVLLTGRERGLVLAFALVLVGDVLINLTPWMRLSIVPFTLAHLSLAAHFSTVARSTRRDLATLAPIAGVSAAFFWVHAEGLQGGLGAAAAGYLAVLSLMVWRGTCVLRGGGDPRRWLLAAGAWLFYVTDLLVVALQVTQERRLLWAIWLLYPPALICLSVSSWFAQAPAVGSRACAP